MRPLQGLFISGTDTGVGKTFVGVALLHALRAQGWRVTPRKPVESGCRAVDGKWLAQDGQDLAMAAGLHGAEADAVVGYRFPAPLAPDLAARLVGQRLYLADLLRACTCPAGHFRLTEGAGGLYSPIAEDAVNADLAQALGDPVVLVAEDRLGTLSSCLLALEALDRRNMSVAALVLNRRPAAAHPDMDNAAALRQRTSVPVLVLPTCRDTPEDQAAEDRSALVQKLSIWSSSMVKPPESD